MQSKSSQLVMSHQFFLIAAFSNSCMGGFLKTSSYQALRLKSFSLFQLFSSVCFGVSGSYISLLCCKTGSIWPVCPVLCFFSFQKNWDMLCVQDVAYIELGCNCIAQIEELAKFSRFPNIKALLRTISPLGLKMVICLQ